LIFTITDSVVRDPDTSKRFAKRFDSDGKRSTAGRARVLPEKPTNDPEDQSLRSIELERTPPRTALSNL
jgi:hypothetical protein